MILEHGKYYVDRQGFIVRVEWDAVDNCFRGQGMRYTRDGRSSINSLGDLLTEHEEYNKLEAQRQEQLKEEPKMKLEVGKKYVTRGGGVVEIVGDLGFLPYKFTGSNDITYNEDGFQVHHSSECPADLIREHEEPKMKPHVHAEWIKLAADGVEVQWSSDDDNWGDAGLSFIVMAKPGIKFRLKPQPKPDEVILSAAFMDADGNLSIRYDCECRPNLRLTFDGETGQLKDAEVIKCT